MDYGKIAHGHNNEGNAACRYVEAVIHAAPVRGSSTEEAGSVMCVIRRCEDVSAALLPVDGGPPAIAPKQADHFVFRLDSNFTVLCKYIHYDDDDQGGIIELSNLLDFSV